MHLQACALLLAVFITTVAGAHKAKKTVPKCASDDSHKFRFVNQLSVNGCVLFVYDAGAKDGTHLVVEPLLCVKEKLNKLLPIYDTLTKQTFLRIPVILRDDGMLKEVQRHHQHLSPKSVKFATVSRIRVSTDYSSAIKVLGFDWIPESATGILNLEYKSLSKSCGIISSLESSEVDILNTVLLTAVVNSMGSSWKRNYRLVTQNQRFFEPEFYNPKLRFLPSCRKVKYARSISIKNCITRVYQKLNTKGYFLAEPLLCHNIANMSTESIRYDYSRDMYYLKLDVTLHDTNVNVKAQLVDLKPKRVVMMQLWRARSLVASALNRRFVIGPLMVSADRKSAQVRVYCKTDYNDCKTLRSAIISDPFNLWKHVRFSVYSMAPENCIIKSDAKRYLWKIQESVGASQSADCGFSLKHLCPRGTACKYSYKTSDGKTFVKIQQRLTGKMSFQRTWAEYERGFGDDTDFWIGLSTIHSLSKNGAKLRVEMKLWNGTQLHVEYAGFKVRNASTKYRMTYKEMLKSTSSQTNDAMFYVNGMKFSTMDSDNDSNNNLDCSNSNNGKAGWWFGSCSDCNFNGIYGNGRSDAYMTWHDNGWQPLREVKLMLQV